MVVQEAGNHGMIRWALRVVIAVGIANFFAFFVECVVIGGSAQFGKEDGGRFFVSEHGGSPLTEVSPAAFALSLWHARSLLVTHPLAMLAAWLLRRGLGGGPPHP